MILNLRLGVSHELNPISNFHSLIRTSLGWYSWFITKYSWERGHLAPRTLYFRSNTARRLKSMPQCTRTAKRTHQWRVRYLHTSFVRSDECDRAIFRIAITRDGRIRRGALHAGPATSARRYSGKSKIPCLRYTSRCRMVTNASEPAALLPRLACNMHRCI